MSRELLLAQVADLLAVGRSTAYRLAEQGLLWVPDYEDRREARADSAIVREHMARLGRVYAPMEQPVRALAPTADLIAYARQLIEQGERAAEEARERSGAPARSRVDPVTLDLAYGPWFVTLAEAAETLRCSRVGLYRRARAGRVVIVRVGGAAYR